MTETILAAGTVPWRRRAGQLEVLLVHRPKYDDWSWPKGKLDPDELLPVAAARETLEETGYTVRLGRPLSPASYTVLDRQGSPARKAVAYWAAEVTGGTGALLNEIDTMAWLDPDAAWRRLDYSRDRDQLAEIVRDDHQGTLCTWPLAIVRHAKSVPRTPFEGDDQSRPLTEAGLRQADGLIDLLAAYGVNRLVSSNSVRCVQTLAPYAAARALPLKKKIGLSEEGYLADPARAVKHARRLLTKGRPAALCTHRPVLPAVLTALAESAARQPATGADPVIDGDPVPHARSPRETLLEVADLGMLKGETLVCHVRDGVNPLIVAVERVPPLVGPDEADEPG